VELVLKLLNIIFYIYCTKYVSARNKLKNNIQLINIPFVLNVLLYGDEGESYETNSIVFQQVQLFIKETGRFINWIFYKITSEKI
jgi:glutaredoxin 2